MSYKAQCVIAELVATKQALVRVLVLANGNTGYGYRWKTFLRW